MKDTREYILSVSLNLFLQKGFKEVTIKDLVEASGLSKGAFYHYYDSKEKLCRAVIDKMLNTSLLEQIYHYDSKSISLYDFYHAYAKDMVQSMSPQDNSGNTVSLNYFSFLSDALNIFPDLRGSLSKFYDFQRDYWKEIIQNAKNSGEINTKMDDLQIANLFIYSSDGLSMYYILFKDNVNEAANALTDLWDHVYQELKG